MRNDYCGSSQPNARGSSCQVGGIKPKHRLCHLEEDELLLSLQSTRHPLTTRSKRSTDSLLKVENLECLYHLLGRCRVRRGHEESYDKNWEVTARRLSINNTHCATELLLKYMLQNPGCRRLNPTKIVLRSLDRIVSAPPEPYAIIQQLHVSLAYNECRL